MLPLPATRFELAVTSVVRVKLGLSKGSLFLLVGSACLRRDHGDVCMEGDELKAGFGYVFRPEDADRVFTAVSQFGVNIVFVGHTHEPVMWRINGEGDVALLNDDRVTVSLYDRLVINVGTVGCPRSIPYASYAIVEVDDDGKVDVELRKLSFNYSAYRDSLLGANVDVPIWLEDMLSKPQREFII